MNNRLLTVAVAASVLGAAEPALAQDLANHFTAGGPVISNVIVVPIFWGKSWAANPGVNAFVGATSTIVSGRYIQGLAQYGVSPGAVASPLVVDWSDPPVQFSDGDIEGEIQIAMWNNQVPWPAFLGSRALYVVFVPPGYTNPSAGVNVNGSHSFFGTIEGTVYYAWVATSNVAVTTTRLSHEIVEALTDPEGGGNNFFDPSETCAGATGWCEIGDVCQGLQQSLGGTTVEAYYSRSDDACIIPGLYVPQPPRWWLLPGGPMTSGGLLQGGLSVTLGGNGRLYAFARGDDGSLRHITEAWDEAWSGAGGWYSAGGVAGDGEFVAATNADGRVEVFAIGSDGALWHNWENWVGGSWSGWYSLGGSFFGSPRVARNANGLLEAFAIHTGDGALWHIRQTGASDWGGYWFSLGGDLSYGFFSPPMFEVATNADGRLEAFIRGGEKKP
jgi:hypothetical protein